MWLEQIAWPRVLHANQNIRHHTEIGKPDIVISLESMNTCLRQQRIPICGVHKQVATIFDTDTALTTAPTLTRPLVSFVQQTNYQCIKRMCLKLQNNCLIYLTSFSYKILQPGHRTVLVGVTNSFTKHNSYRLALQWQQYNLYIEHQQTQVYTRS